MSAFHRFIKCHQDITSFSIKIHLKATYGILKYIYLRTGVKREIFNSGHYSRLD